MSKLGKILFTGWTGLFTAMIFGISIYLIVYGSFCYPKYYKVYKSLGQESSLLIPQWCYPPMKFSESIFEFLGKNSN